MKSAISKRVGRKQNALFAGEHLVDGKFSVKDLVDISRLRVLFEDFSKTTGFTTGFVSYPDQEILIATGWRNACTKYHRPCPASLEACIESSSYLTSCLRNLKELNIKPCGNGLVDGATPVIVRGKHLASISTGQVLFGPPDLKYFKRQAKKYGYDEKSYLEAIRQVPVVTEGQLKQVLIYLSSLAVFVAEEGLNKLRVSESAKLLKEENKRRKRVEQTLRQGEEQFRAMFELASIGMAQADPQTGQWLRVNQRMCKITGYSAEELLKTRISEITHPDDRQKDWKEFQRVVKGMAPDYRIEKRYIRKDGSIAWVSVNMTVVRNPLGQPVRTVATIEDITERRRLEHEVIEISSREQRRIGQELHDDICQWLCGIAVTAEVLAQDLANDSPANAPLAQEIVKHTRHTLESLRILSRGLTPAVIRSEGLAGALIELAGSMERMFHIRCLCDCADAVEVRNQVAALHIYRIAQEAITNAVRHGEADNVCILLRTQDDRVTMLISDDGHGIPQPLPKTDGMGLDSMRYRADSIGGTLEIRPGASGGTEVVCTFPNKL